MDADYFTRIIDLVSSTQNVATFLHNTSSIEIAHEIINEGFNFQSHIDYCTDYLNGIDMVLLKYISTMREAYGPFTIIIQINKNLIAHYSQLLEHTPYHFSEIISIKDPELNNDGEPIYRLAPQFIKGFVNRNDASFVLNAGFNPSFIAPQFEVNLKRLLRL